MYMYIKWDDYKLILQNICLNIGYPIIELKPVNSLDLSCLFYVY